jgi:hypothetical protein
VWNYTYIYIYISIYLCKHLIYSCDINKKEKSEGEVKYDLVITDEGSERGPRLRRDSSVDENMNVLSSTSPTSNIKRNMESAFSKFEAEYIKPYFGKKNMHFPLHLNVVIYPSHYIAFVLKKSYIRNYFFTYKGGRKEEHHSEVFDGGI